MGGIDPLRRPLSTCWAFSTPHYDDILRGRLHTHPDGTTTRRPLELTASMSIATTSWGSRYKHRRVRGGKLGAFPTIHAGESAPSASREKGDGPLSPRLATLTPRPDQECVPAGAGVPGLLSRLPPLPPTTLPAGLRFLLSHCNSIKWPPRAPSRYPRSTGAA